MKCEILLVVQLTLLYLCDSHKWRQDESEPHTRSIRDVGTACQTDSDCGWLACVDHQCQMCGKAGTTCQSGGLTCCKGTICQPIYGLNSSSCVPSSCQSSEECPTGFGCLLRLGKCGLCKTEGLSCTLPYDSEECCSSWCDLSGSSGTCKNAFTTTTATTSGATTSRPIPWWDQILIMIRYHYRGRRRHGSPDFFPTV